MSATRRLPGAEADPSGRPPGAEARPQPSASAPSHPRRRRVLPVLLILLAVFALVVWGGSWLHGRFLYVHETDARIDADMIAVASRVEGWLTSLDVREGDAVSAGQRLAHVDSRAAELRAGELRAELDSLRAERARIKARRSMLEEQTRSRMRSVESELSAARAFAESLDFELRLATAEYERARTLSKTGVVSTNELDRARTTYNRARQERLRAEAEVAGAQAKLAETEAQLQELTVLDAEAVVLERRLVQYHARVQREELVIEEHDVFSPGVGVVSRTFVESGEYVRQGQRIALMHDPRKIWVEANIRETEIGKIEVGRKVRVVVDAYPDLAVEGTVERIGQATTGEFALLPTPNPSGNFTKVTQRLPVRIAVEQRGGLLRPGMLVEIYVDVAGA